MFFHYKNQMLVKLQIQIICFLIQNAFMGNYAKKFRCFAAKSAEKYFAASRRKVLKRLIVYQKTKKHWRGGRALSSMLHTPRGVKGESAGVCLVSYRLKK